MNYYSGNDIVKKLQEEGYDINQRNFVFYATEKKILPETVIHNNKKRYTDKHLFYLKAILILKEKGDTLEKIKKSLDEMDEEAIQLISEVYQPFSSMNIIEETKLIYYSNYMSNNILSDSATADFQQNSFSSNSMQSLDSVSPNSLSDQSVQGNYQSFNGDISKSSRSMGNTTSSSYPQSMYKQNTNNQSLSDSTSNKTKRTVVNENIILETKSINNDCLKEIINEIEKIYNKHTGDGFND